VDRHHISADPDPTFHFNADPDLDPDPTPRFTHVGKSEFFNFLVIVIGVTIFYILHSIVLLNIG
jgi:hypothetical protein